MPEPLRVADVFRAGQADFLACFGDQLSCQQRRVLRDICECRTAALGGNVEQCEGCGHRRVHYNSCRNRHCPRCQAGARAAWFEAREAELLPVPYFHVVFTLPHQLTQLAQQNQRVVFQLLFRAAADTLLEVAAHPKHLGARIGALAVLHTWGQNLMAHPHVHWIVTGGGLSLDGQQQWIPARRSRKKRRQSFFLPVRVLSRVFRGKFIHGLKQAFAQGELGFHGQIADIAEPRRFEELLNSVVRRDWVVYAKRPFGGPEQVLKYLARYTHRVAISDSRIASLDDDQVTFRYKDYADQGQTKLLKLTPSEFIRRFLLHTLPSGFTRIRYYGFLANRHRAANLQRCREMLGCPPQAAEDRVADCPPEPDRLRDLEERAVGCPACRDGKMIVTQRLDRAHGTLPTRAHLDLQRSATSTSDESLVEFVIVSRAEVVLDTS